MPPGRTKCAAVDMPIYVYGCEGCGRVEEHIQRFSDPPLTECEHCGGRLEKQVTAAAFHLKGGGWYKDLYSSSNADSGSSSGRVVHISSMPAGMMAGRSS